MNKLTSALLVSLVLLTASTVRAEFYFLQPRVSLPGGDHPRLGFTEFWSANETTGATANHGIIQIGGANARVGCAAADPTTGDMYVFEHEDAAVGLGRSRLAEMTNLGDPTAMPAVVPVAVPTGAAWHATYIAGCGFDQFGTLWVIDAGTATVRDYDVAAGAFGTISIAIPGITPFTRTNLWGADIAFDSTNRCMISSALSGFAATFYDCDVGAGTVTARPFTIAGPPSTPFDNSNRVAAAGIAASVFPDTCAGLWAGIEGLSADEMYLLDLTTDTISRSFNTGASAFWYAVDATSIPVCLSCGNGMLDGAEQCDDGNTETGDGCDGACQEEFGYECTGTPSTCAGCLDTGSGVDQDCDAATPACDNSTDPGTCQVCVDSSSGGVDDGCSAPDGACDDSGSPNVCVQCTEDADCATGVCDPSSNMCVPCLDTAAGSGTDNGCTGASPVCNEMASPSACVECLVDAHCPAAMPLCDPASMECVVSICGNGIVEGAETCDDNNVANGDGCSDACAVESGYSCGALLADTGEELDGTTIAHLEENCRWRQSNMADLSDSSAVYSTDRCSASWLPPTEAMWLTSSDDGMCGAAMLTAPVYYHQYFEVPAAALGSLTLSLRCNVDNVSDVFINGTNVGTCTQFNTAAPSISVPASVFVAGQNVISFDVVNSGGPGGLMAVFTSSSVCHLGGVAPCECVDAADCDDMNDCTTNTCVIDQCETTNDMAGSMCAAGVCDGAASCMPCFDTAGGSGTDLGCAPGAAICDTASSPSACVTCLDSGSGTDTGCGGMTPVCDASVSGGECVQCLATSDCAAGVCDPGTNTCVECFDSAGGTSTDSGCTGASPICDESAPPAVCVECTMDSHCPGICDETTNTCVTCLDDTAGGMDDGCSAGATVCDDSTAGGECVECEDDAASGMDNGCAGAAPICDASAAGGPTCVACADSGTGVDDGCGGSTTVCDVSDPAAPVCVSCLDDASGVTADAGCPAGSPVCDTSMAPAMCQPCVDSAGTGDTDDGCATTVPVCDTSVSPAMCVECVANADCPGGACDTATNTCAPCVDDASGAMDSGCGGTRAVCDESAAGGPVCVACENDAGGSTTDFGCDMSTPLCDEAAPGGPACVECLGDGDCTSGVCDETVNTCVGCLDSMATGIDDGCVGATPVCDAGSGSCLECQDDVDGGQDDGCPRSASVCDVSDPSSPMCVACEDDATGAMTDNGCSDAAPICDPLAPGGPSCIECDDNTDCATGACDVTTNTCVACVNDTTGATDSGCSEATPVCDTTGAVAECVACEDSAVTGADNGCEAPRGVCDVSDPSAPVCVACQDDVAGGADDGCGGDAIVCDTSGDEPACVACEDTAAMPDPGCADPTTICDVSGDAVMCVECLTGDDCPATAPVCNPSGTCVPGCDDDPDCGITPETPVCDVDAMACVECNASADCADPSATVCNPATNSCVECVMDDDCPDATLSVCMAGAQVCVECVADDDCDGGVCDGITNECVGCLSAADCPPDVPVCDEESTTCVGCLVNGDCEDEDAPLCSATNTCVECTTGGDCPSGTCDPATGTCSGPECSSDSDCMMIDAALPVCDTGSCVECVYDAHCDEGQTCDPVTNTCDPGCMADADCEDPAAPVCGATGACVECGTDDDCESGACNVSTGSCGTGCAIDEDCAAVPGLPACDAVDGVCVECLTEDHCDSGVCDTAAEACVECTDDTHCSGGVCDLTANSCVECLGDDDCDGLCDPTINRCYSACTDDADCVNPAVPVCDGGACVECLVDAHCADGELCDALTNSCAPACELDTDCWNPDFPYCNLATGSCVACATDEHCPDGMICDEATLSCVDRPGCGSDDDCTDANRCDVSTGLCVGCLDDMDCGEDERCTDAQICATGCESDDDCDDGTAPRCLDTGVCGCANDDECAAGLVCGDDAMCQSPVPGGLAGGALCATPGAGTGTSGHAAWLLLLGAVFAVRRRR